MKIYTLFIAIFITALQSGCVVGRRTVALPIATLGSTGAAKGEFSVVSVTDDRTFQNKPSEPSTPSIDGDVASLSAEQKSLMIGRQRNTYGKAMGDIALPAGDSVKERTKLLVQEIMKSRGYTIVSSPSAANTAEISIDQFWAWGTPGMWSVAFEARVYCTLTLKRSDKSAKIVVQGNGTNRGQVAKNENWQSAYDRAFADFVTKLNAELDKNQF